ncbi:MAG: DUF4935 domain-containing protein [Ketobacter sp.]|nr:DUF4935 domain-containing protein [Planctomycetota bacterium]MCP5017320.1 DUF4935 domain-containing protein [Ketobacter sp.]
MKNLFHGYYIPTEEEFSTLWQNAIFVFDTNVLTSLYRYRKTTTEQFFNVLDNMKERVWIPYHVALEYQRNRNTVIAEQHTLFSDVHSSATNVVKGFNSEIEKLQLRKKHSPIKLDTFHNELIEWQNRLQEELKQLKEEHLIISNSDPIREKLTNIFDGKVGQKPLDQSEMDKLNAEAVERFKGKIPPGYMDTDKDNDKEPSFHFDGITYQKKYSDYVIWQQLISYASSEEVTDVIFITDDNKEDWWLKQDQKGVKTISPRPELVHEIKSKSNLRGFYLYSSDSFLKHAHTNLNAEITDEAIEEIRTVTEEQHWKKKATAISRLKLMESTLLTNIITWLSSRYNSKQTRVIKEGHFSELLLDNGTEKYAVQVLIDIPGNIQNYEIKNALENAYRASSLEYDADYFCTVICSSDYQIKSRVETLFSLPNLKPSGIIVEVGAPMFNESGDTNIEYKHLETLGSTPFL